MGLHCSWPVTVSAATDNLLAATEAAGRDVEDGERGPRVESSDAPQESVCSVQQLCKKLLSQQFFASDQPIHLL
jgi:hypothetical protein